MRKTSLLLFCLLNHVFTFAQHNQYPSTGNVGINLPSLSSSPQNKLQIGGNPQNWSGNDLVVSSDNTKGAIAIGSDATHTFIYGDRDIAIRPGFGKWSVYARGSTGYVGIGFNNPASMLHVQQSSNTDWAATIQNLGGSGKGLRIQAAAGNATPVFQVDDNNAISRFLVRSDGRVGVGTTTPRHNFHVKGRIFLEGTEAYPNGWVQNYFHWRGHSLIMGTEEGTFAHNAIEIKPGGSTSGTLHSYLHMFTTLSPGNHDMRVQLNSNGHTFFNGGNVGIGSATPQYKLDVVGSGNFSNGLDVQGTVNLNGGKISHGANIANDNSAVFVNTSTTGYGFLSQGGGSGKYAFHFLNQAGATILYGNANGNIGIGTYNPDAKLAVKGQIHAEEVLIDLNVPAPDYVFEENYDLPSLGDVEQYIKQYKHLPEIPPAKEMEQNGINVSEMNMLLLKKIEELTLYVIELKKENEEQNKKINQLLSQQ